MMAIGNAFDLGSIYDANRDSYQGGYGQQMSRYDYERRRHEEEMRYRQMQYRQMQVMQQTPRPADKPVSNEKEPSPVLLLLKD